MRSRALHRPSAPAPRATWRLRDLLPVAVVTALVASSALASAPLSAAANGGTTPAITVGQSAALLKQPKNLEIALPASLADGNYQVTLKFVDSKHEEQTNGVLAATVSGTTSIPLYPGNVDGSYSGPKIGFSGTKAEVAAALSTVTWTPDSLTTGLTLRVGLTSALQANQYYDANSGRYYQYFQFAKILATDAEIVAREPERKLFGMTGYLAHLTSKAENDFVAGEISASNIWIGATDVTTEGVWKWISEANLPEEPFVVTSWAASQPDNYLNGEDYASTNMSNQPAGMWNDLPNFSDSIQGYLVEYGGRSGETSTAVTLTTDALMTAGGPEAMWAAAPSSPTTSSSQNFALTFNYDVSGIAADDFRNAGTATGCTFTPAAATATAGTPLTVVVTGCSTGTLQPELKASSVTVSVDNALSVPAATAQAITLMATQGITWAPTNTQVLANQSPLTPNALATSTGTGQISYAVQSAGTTNCTVESSTAVLSFTAAGTCVVRATAAANSTFTAASTDVTFQIGALATALALDLAIETGNAITSAPVTYSLSGFRPGSAWDLVLRSTPQTIASGVVDGTGSLRGSTVIPAGLAAGWHSLTLSGTSIAGEPVSTTTWFEVGADGTLQAEQPNDPSKTAADQKDVPSALLAETGAALPGALLPGLLLIALGAALLRVRALRVR